MKIKKVVGYMQRTPGVLSVGFITFLPIASTLHGAIGQIWNCRNVIGAQQDTLRVGVFNGGENFFPEGGFK